VRAHCRPKLSAQERAKDGKPKQARLDQSHYDCYAGRGAILRAKKMQWRCESKTMR
jgi:hypothetical protein